MFSKLKNCLFGNLGQENKNRFLFFEKIDLFFSPTTHLLQSFLQYIISQNLGSKSSPLAPSKGESAGDDSVGGVGGAFTPRTFKGGLQSL